MNNEGVFKFVCFQGLLGVGSLSAIRDLTIRFPALQLNVHYYMLKIRRSIDQFWQTAYFGKKFDCQLIYQYLPD